MERLFGNKIEPACKYCAESFKQIGKNQILCRKHGVVLVDYSCRHFFYDPLKRIPKQPLELQKFEEDEFEL